MKACLATICFSLLMNLQARAQGIPRARNIRFDIFLNDVNKNCGDVFIAFWPNQMLHTIINYDPHPGESVIDAIQRIIKDLPFTITTRRRNDGRFGITLNRIPGNTVDVKVIDETGEAQPNVLVAVKNACNGPIQSYTDIHGLARLYKVEDDAVLMVSGININDAIQSTRGHSYLEVNVRRKTKALDSIVISRRHNNGIDPLTLANLPAAYSSIDSESLNRIVATNIIDHFSRSASGLLSGPGSGNSLGLTIRGRNTLYSFNGPLVVMDHLAYPGNSGDINPYDINSVTILKDAAAGSIWGTRSSNGVIVLAGNEGAYNKKAAWTFTMNTTLSEKPQLNYMPWMRPASFIDAERTLFNNNAYDSRLYYPEFPVTPALRLYSMRRDNNLSKTIVDDQIARLASHSSLDDLKKYFYRTSLSQQYHINVAGGRCTDKYYASFGYDYDPTALVRNQYERYTLRGSYTAHPFTPNLETSVTLNFANIHQQNNNAGTLGANYPYARAADDRGYPAIVTHLYNPGYIDTAGNGYLQDWHYRPLQELQLADNHTSRTILNVQTALEWRLNKLFSAGVIYRRYKSWSLNKIVYNKQGFYVRDLVNQFTDLSGASPVYPVPLDNILSSSDSSTTAENLRAQLNFVSPSNKRHQWKALLGGELSDQGQSGHRYTDYSYNGHGNPPQMDFLHFYPTLTKGLNQIPNNDQIMGGSNRYLSAFSNLYYTCPGSFTLFGSFRLDGSNFIGVENHQKWGASWSLGGSRQLLNYTDSPTKYAPSLKLRVSYGCNGNVSTRIANLTISYLGNNIYGSRQSAISNPPDPSLGWENTWVENGGLDFAFFRDSLSPLGRLHGSVDVYWKQAGDLLGYDSVPLSTGYAVFLRNVAGIHGRGIDLVINSENTRGIIKWESSLLLSLAKDWVSHYPFLPQLPASFVADGYHRVGESPTGLYSYRSAGLDPLTGNPRGYLNGKSSMDYPGIMMSASGDYRYNGSYQPTIFGSLLNSITWKRFSLSARLGFKGGYWMRRSSINYDDLVQERTAGHKDYDRRWKIPGDEKSSSVPSVPLVNDPSRDAFYLNSDILITKADHLRWQDCQLSYNWTVAPFSKKKIPFKQAIFYIYLNNPGIIWKANKYGIDPDAAGYGDLPAVRAWSIGSRISF